MRLVGECEKGVVCLSDIDVSGVNDMSRLFRKKKIDWGDPKNSIAEWDVSNVKHMSAMFAQCDFDADLSEWNVSGVENMQEMFARCTFDGDLSRWDVSKVRDMSCMFQGSRFRGDIASWDVSNVEDMPYLFSPKVLSCPCEIDWNNPNNDISQWDIGRVESMFGMFFESNFDRDISSWTKRLAPNVDLTGFNQYSEHERRFGSIENLQDFYIKQFDQDYWVQKYRQAIGDKERFEILKLIKRAMDHSKSRGK